MCERDIQPGQANNKHYCLSGESAEAIGLWIALWWSLGDNRYANGWSLLTSRMDQVICLSLCQSSSVCSAVCHPLYHVPQIHFTKACDQLDVNAVVDSACVAKTLSFNSSSLLPFYVNLSVLSSSLDSSIAAGSKGAAAPPDESQNTLIPPSTPNLKHLSTS